MTRIALALALSFAAVSAHAEAEMAPSFTDNVVNTAKAVKSHVFAPLDFSEIRVGAHIASRHFQDGRMNYGYHDTNPGLYARDKNGWTVGGYCNSESKSEYFQEASNCRPAVYAGRTFETGDVHGYGLRGGVMAGVVVGYERGVLPMIAATAAYGPIRLTYVPGVNNGQLRSPHVINLGLDLATLKF